MKKKIITTCVIVFIMIIFSFSIHFKSQKNQRKIKIKHKINNAEEEKNIYKNIINIDDIHVEYFKGCPNYLLKFVQDFETKYNNRINKLKYSAKEILIYGIWTVFKKLLIAYRVKISSKECNRYEKIGIMCTYLNIFFECKCQEDIFKEAVSILDLMNIEDILNFIFYLNYLHIDFEKYIKLYYGN
ncbi:hypothetical protein H312_01482 [Anncaliia algerae PRA339]|uniref:Uncharacterized protein n=1 Tax=Anncaliia algerae PRA339 TaxID=1288291 RepID=A0A059F2E5_9MICR|nr:hypothetical protein H312_01482 [Anncaliia algerae PRA339]